MRVAGSSPVVPASFFNYLRLSSFPSLPFIPPELLQVAKRKPCVSVPVSLLDDLCVQVRAVLKEDIGECSPVANFAGSVIF